jgi:hypothetical protein
MGTLLMWSRTGADSSKLPGRSRVKLNLDNHSRVGAAEGVGRDDAGVKGRGDRKDTDHSVIRASVRIRA